MGEDVLPFWKLCTELLSQGRKPILGGTSFEGGRVLSSTEIPIS